MKALVTGTNKKNYSDHHFIVKMIKDFTKGVEFPCLAEVLSEKGDKGDMIVRLPNGNAISTLYLQIAD